MPTRRLPDATSLIASLPAPEPEIPAPTVTLPEPMVQYACNQQGCCCGGWRIHFQPHDLVRLAKTLPANERPHLVEDMEINEELGDDGRPVVSSAFLTDAEGRCRFLASDGRRCGVHASVGIEALPDICVDFPVVACETPAGADLFYDPVCPSVLDALAASNDAVREIQQEAPYPDAGVRRRASHARSFPTIHFGVATLDANQLAVIRGRILDLLAGTRRPLPDQVFAIDAAYAEVGRGDRPPEAFALTTDAAPPKYWKFLRECAEAHSHHTLEAVFSDYRRFIFAIPVSGARWDRLAGHLDSAAHAERALAILNEHSLEPFLRRYLAHRHFAPFFVIQRRLHFAAGALVHVLATALRFAAAFEAVLERPVDQDVMKAALGTAEYVYRSLEIAPESLPWFDLWT
jgi:Fe-S-cluster containining protein